MSKDSEYQKLLNDGQKHAREYMKGRASGGRMSDAEQDRRDIARGVHRHEAHMHKGEPETKLAHGGAPKRGGTKTNIMIEAGGGQAEKQAATQQGMQIGARLAAQKMAGAGPRPPMPPRPASPAPAGPSGPPIAPTAAAMGAKKGGRVKK